MYCMKVKLIKSTGAIKTGELISLPQVGKCVELIDDHGKITITTQVRKVNDYKFKTKNSEYTIEEIR